MRAPSAPGTPVDAQRLTSWLERFDGYRVAVTEARIRRWLDNFRGEDADLGARVLDSVSFLKPEDIENALRTMADQLPGWHRDEAQRDGRWRFVAFSISAGESGDTMLHALRRSLGLTSKQFNSLFIHKSDLLREGLGPNDSVVFLDDFAGTGQQACSAWRAVLAELLPGSPKSYLIVVAAGQRAVERIGQETSLKLVASEVLMPGDDIFSAECAHFTEEERETLLRYCRRADRRNPRGFGDCGFVLVLAHRTPNNSIPVLHASHVRWQALFPRN